MATRPPLHVAEAAPRPTLEIVTTPQVVDRLRVLVAGGLHGATVEEAAERLVCLYLLATTDDES